ncbi:hypothetical protein SpCBS45565_g03804 [Spizellomyces sp. 'palustris']|nr:hypothetical protein SpCBS45565_g03804 [Spizellomyces sp. 'palustris']
MSPDKLSLTITLAVVCGLFPVLGVTSLLCLAAAWRFGLNTPVMQAINLLLTPADVALSLPFMRFGEHILHREPLPLSPADLFAHLKQVGFWSGASTIITGLGCAILGWAVAMAPVGTVIYYALRPLVRRIMLKKDAAAELEDPLLRARRRSCPDVDG